MQRSARCLAGRLILHIVLLMKLCFVHGKLMIGICVSAIPKRIAWPVDFAAAFPCPRSLIGYLAQKPSIPPHFPLRKLQRLVPMIIACVKEVLDRNA